MSAPATMRVTGDKQAIRALKSFGGAVQRRIARKGLSKAGSLLNKALKAAAPSRTGSRNNPTPGILKKSIGRRSKTYGQAVVEIVGPRKGFPDPITGKDVHRTAWVAEYGTSKRAPQPFVRPTFDSMQQQLVAKINEDLASAIDTEAAKRAT